MCPCLPGSYCFDKIGLLRILLAGVLSQYPDSFSPSIEINNRCLHYCGYRFWSINFLNRLIVIDWNRVISIYRRGSDDQFRSMRYVLVIQVLPKFQMSSWKSILPTTRGSLSFSKYNTIRVIRRRYKHADADSNLATTPSVRHVWSWRETWRQISLRMFHGLYPNAFSGVFYA